MVYLLLLLGLQKARALPAFGLRHLAQVQGKDREVTTEEKQQEAAEAPPRIPVDYHLTWDVVTEAGFRLKIERNVDGSELAKTVRDFDKYLPLAHMKPPEQDTFKVELPLATPATQTAAHASGEAVWIKGEGGGPPRCSLHGPGRWNEGEKDGKAYAFWGCTGKVDGKYCRPKGDPK